MSKQPEASDEQTVHIAMSTMADGSMSVGVTARTRDANRQAFLERLGMNPGRTVLVALRYEGDDYCRYHTIGETMAGDGIVTPPSMVSDALFTTTPDLALFLPIADCIGAVLYDPVRHVLGLSHLGRHNLIGQGGAKSVRYMVEQFGSDPAAIVVFMSAAAGRAQYPLYDFDGRSLHDVAAEQLFSAGVSARHLTVDPADTTSEATLFSHSAFLKGQRMLDGRQAIVATMR
jgi:hypothetical protein